MKKFLAMFLALLMLAMPVLSLAEGDFLSEAVANGRMAQRTVTFEIAPTGDENVDQLLGELLGALSIVTNWQEGDAPQGGLRVNLNGTDVLTVDFAAANEMVYLSSDLLAGNTVVFANGDEQPITENIMSMLVAMGAISEEDAAEALNQMNTALAGAQNPMADVDFEAIAAGFDLSALMALAEDMAGKVEQADVSGKPGDTDPAIMAVTLTLTAEDIVKVYDAIFDALKANKEYLALLDTMVVSVNDEPMSAEDAINQMQQVVDQEFAKVLTSDVPVTVYLDGDDQPVAAVLAFTMDMAEEGEEAQPVTADVVYKRNTDGERVLHSVLYNIEMSDAKVVMALDVALEGDNIDAELMIHDDEEAISLAFKKTSEATDTEKTVNVRVGLATQEMGLAVTYDAHDVKNGADAESNAVVKVSMDGTELVTVNIQTRTVDPVASIVTEDAIRLAELSQEDFQGWFVGVIGNLQTWLITAMQALPSNILMMLLGQ